MHYKVKRHIPRLIFALVALIILGVATSMVGDYFLKRADKALGVDDFEIKEVVIEKRFDQSTPMLVISYKTTNPSTTAVSVDEIWFEPQKGTEFYKEVHLSNDYAGKNITITVKAENFAGERIEYKKTVVIPRNLQPAISIN